MGLRCNAQHVMHTVHAEMRGGPALEQRRDTDFSPVVPARTDNCRLEPEAMAHERSPGALTRATFSITCERPTKAEVHAKLDG